MTSLQFIGATNQIVTSGGQPCPHRQRRGWEVRSITGLPDFMQAAASTANGATVVGGGEDSTLRIWSGTDGKELPRLPRSKNQKGLNHELHESNESHPPPVSKNDS